MCKTTECKQLNDSKYYIAQRLNIKDIIPNAIINEYFHYREVNNKELYKISQHIEDENETYNIFNSDEEVIEYIKKLLNQEK